MSETIKPAVLVGVTDHLDPELQAMILAKYSRSYGSVMTKIPTTQEEAAKVKASLKLTYQNYGHKSVGQLGVTTVFFEGVSMLAAMFITDGELFNGQESSTRYIDYTNQPAIDCSEPRIKHWQEIWRQFYIEALEATIADLTLKYPWNPEDNALKYSNTIKARAFDICGGILPAGFTTCVGFTGTFDTINDQLAYMAHSPLIEVRELAEVAVNGLVEKYPNAAYSWNKIWLQDEYRLYDEGLYSNLHMDCYFYRKGGFEYNAFYHNTPQQRLSIIAQHSSYSATVALDEKYYPITDVETDAGVQSRLTLECQVFGHRFSSQPGMNKLALTPLAMRLDALDGSTRLKYQKFPKSLSNEIRFRITGMMDYRTYRDIHRHRNGSRPLPLLSAEDGLHLYYVWNLTQELGKKFETLFAKMKEEISAGYAGVSDVDKSPNRSKEFSTQMKNLHATNWQYAIPMAAMVPYYYECDLNQLLYMLELRTSKTVHQTLRIEMMAAYDQLMAIFPDLKVHVDLDSNNFTLKRGEQAYKNVFSSD